MLDKLEIENKTFTKITAKERIEIRQWNTVALREAVINAFVHNDYSKEIAPKFELFNNRLEITSYGGIPDGLSEKEFFEGYSIPRNKEIMRIFRDLDLVEQLGSGLPRILKYYSKDCFYFTENHIRMILPIKQVTEQVKALILMLDGEMDRQAIQDSIGLSHRENFRSKYLKPALKLGLIQMTIPHKPNSKHQKYMLSPLGLKFIKRV